MKQFYQALELQWECLARLAEREDRNGNEVRLRRQRRERVAQGEPDGFQGR